MKQGLTGRKTRDEKAGTTSKQNQRPTKTVIHIERVCYLSEAFWEIYTECFERGYYTDSVISHDEVCDDLSELLHHLKTYLKEIEVNEGTVCRL